IEDDGPPARRAPCRWKVEVAGVTDDHGVVAVGGPPQQLQLGRSQPKRRAQTGAPAVAPPVPDRYVVLRDVDPGPSQARDDLRIPWVAALVGAEVEHAHQASTPAPLTAPCLRPTRPPPHCEPIPPRRTHL